MTAPDVIHLKRLRDDPRKRHCMTACTETVGPHRWTTDPDKVTCKRCLRTRAIRWLRDYCDKASPHPPHGACKGVPMPTSIQDVAGAYAAWFTLDDWLKAR